MQAGVWEGAAYVPRKRRKTAAVSIVCMQFFTRSLSFVTVHEQLLSHEKLKTNDANLGRLCLTYGAMATSGAQIHVMHAITHCAAGRPLA